MSRKQSNEEPDHKEGVASYRAWVEEVKIFESSGLYGTDYYVERVEKLEKQVKRLKKLLQKERKTK